MRVLITGGSGLIGRHLVQRVLKAGGRPVVVSRHSDLLRRKRESREYEVVQGDVGVPGRWQEAVDGCDAVVNLAGHNLFAERWSAQVKRKIRDSRVYGSEHVAAAIASARSRPQVLVQGSAIGFYGPHGDEELDETSPSGSDFLASVCREWEEASASVEALGVRRAIIRTGVVLAPGEGALKVMTPIFKFAGAPVGGGGGMGPATGQQWMSWIHIDDIAGIFQLALDNPAATGPINGTAPDPARNADFSRALSKTLRKPYTPWRFFVPIGPPDPLLRLMLGEVADVIAKGQKVLPTKALALGYHFQHPDLAEALQDVFKPRPVPQPIPPAPTASRAGSHH
ncbi:TIGR01777 family oxidoreductase [Paludisphaera borealis]|uniref:Epimerase family protein n=1 Tax=Paludisphaera borealis TaxID=1387353 RepID=A0A1U7CN52_9BACT|nr:TIGR01777 family oxidoreductase [Paludisphaera borealis]APW60339.1 Epimerase family protein [Paludisphaera borealis]